MQEKNNLYNIIKKLCEKHARKGIHVEPKVTEEYKDPITKEVYVLIKAHIDFPTPKGEQYKYVVYKIDPETEKYKLINESCGYEIENEEVKLEKMIPKINILHGDDSALYRERVKKLEDIKYKITQVDNVEDLIKEGEKDKYDLIITDGLFGPEKTHDVRKGIYENVDGIVVAKKLREKGITTPIIIYTGIEGIDFAIEAFQHGIQCYIHKNYDKEKEGLENLRRAIKKLIYKSEREENVNHF